MAKTFKFGENGKWATKTGSSLAYNDQNDNFKPMPFSVTRDSIATRVNKEGLIEVVGHDKLRIDYTDSTKGVALLEPARTNKILYSEDFTQWDLSSSGTGASNPTVTSNHAISPDGTQNADRIQFDTGTDANGYSRITETFTIFATEETISIYLKSNDAQEYIVDIIQSNTAYDTVTVTSEWQRFSFTRVNGSPDVYGIGLSSANSNSETADILAWGAQLETGSYATSYIPTSGASVPRAADVANGAGNSEVFNDSEGVLFAQTSFLDRTTAKAISISDGSYTNRILFYLSTSGNFSAYTFVSGSNQCNITVSNYDYSTNNKIALKYKENDFALWINGFKIGVDTSGSVFSNNALTELSFDANGAGADKFFGKTKEIGVYDAVLTDAELEALTSYTSFTNMANELNLTIK